MVNLKGVNLKGGKWVIITPQGHYTASDGGEKSINVRSGNNVTGIEPYRDQFNKPERVQVALQAVQIKQLSRQEIYTMHRLKVKVAFEDEPQPQIVPLKINPQRLQQAEFLDLSHLQMTDLPDWLAKFTKLRKLDISYNQLTPEELVPLSAMSVLEVLDVSHNPLFEECPWWDLKCKIDVPSIQSLWQYLAGLRDLNLSHTGGSAKNYGDLSDLRNLHVLNLSHNRLKTVTGLNLQKIMGLRQLDLSHNKLKKIDFSELGAELSSLQELNLSFNRLGHLTFAPLPRLNKLYLESNSQVSFDPEFGHPFYLQELRYMTYDEGTEIPEGLKKKLDSFNQTETKPKSVVLPQKKIQEVVRRIQTKIRQNWIRPSGDYKGLSCVIEIGLKQGGVVETAKIISSSGNTIFDASAIKAVYDASPLPIPYELLADFKHFHFRFSN